ncbi:DNA-3-methyladenine glycosylase family protein [Kordiimonas aquimaris]|uniref:DNA-3-methyladenine glycosylase family protein n=1 Tax=Kordiimonas aquimaris TaxID=707591 RepID=UPI0021CE0AF1|nr:DNA-3-methyladenine glycosylase 2 family protein [Kordiimonas aquimaris]
MNFQLRNSDIKKQLDTLATADSHIAAAIKHVGYPNERVNEQSFAVFLRVIIGQQLSVKAAATISERVNDLVGGDPQPLKFNSVNDEALRNAGLSRQKIAYVRSLCETTENGILDITALPDMSDDDAIAAITAVKGLGVWSAHMYMMFSLGRTDVWPVGDLAVRVGVGRIIGLDDRPTEKETQAIGERWRPYRSAVALLAWHYYSNAPL